MTGLKAEMKQQLEMEMKELQFKRTIKEAYKFFLHNSAHIEIVRS